MKGGLGYCQRCKREAQATIGSMFDTSMICMDCLAKEQAHPRYEEARRVEAEAVRRGDYNFPGIGKPADL